MKKYVEFIANDWFFGVYNKPHILEMFCKANPTVQETYHRLPDYGQDASPRIIEISTDPLATCSYFDMGEDYLNRPHELSVACFNPEVVLKYKMNSDKYVVDEHNITCKESWYLRDIDVNDAGQVNVCICDLRELPYAEQLYWKSFNEEPKWSSDDLETPFRGISQSFVKRMFFNMLQESSALSKIKQILFKWADALPRGLTNQTFTIYQNWQTSPHDERDLIAGTDGSTDLLDGSRFSSAGGGFDGIVKREDKIHICLDSNDYRVYTIACVLNDTTLVLADADCAWWELKDKSLVDKVSKPLSMSKDEWSLAFKHLSILIVEGFKTKAIRLKLDNGKTLYDSKDRSIALLEKIVGSQLSGLREVQEIRSKIDSHYGGRGAKRLKEKVLKQYGTYSKHFDVICETVCKELKTIEATWK